MLIKKIILTAISLFYIGGCFAQETVEKKNRINEHVTEVFQVRKDSVQIKEGSYQAFYRRKIPLAIGHYVHNKKIGQWYFYDQKGKLLQMYNYTKDSLRYEAREDTTSHLRYLIDKVISDTDRVTKPVKAGGRYYGYLPYLGLFKTPIEPYVFDAPGSIITIQLLISPLGWLAEYKVHLFSPLYRVDESTIMDVRLFKEEDRQFIPATFNHDAILSRIIIRCRVTDDGGLDFF